MTLRIQSTLCPNCNRMVSRESQICVICGRVLTPPDPKLIQTYTNRRPDNTLHTRLQAA